MPCRSSAPTGCRPPRSSCSPISSGTATGWRAARVFASTRLRSSSPTSSCMPTGRSAGGAAGGRACRLPSRARSRRPRPHRDRRRASRPARCVERPRGIPDAVFRLPYDQLSLFLGRLFAAAGSARAAARGAGRIRYVTPARAMAHGVQHLLLRFGIASTVREKRVCEEGVTHDLFEVEITEAADIRAFCDQLEVRRPGADVRRAVAASGA